MPCRVNNTIHDATRNDPTSNGSPARYLAQDLSSSISSSPLPPSLPSRSKAKGRRMDEGTLARNEMHARKGRHKARAWHHCLCGRRVSYRSTHEPIPRSPLFASNTCRIRVQASGVVIRGTLVRSLCTHASMPRRTHSILLAWKTMNLGCMRRWRAKCMLLVCECKISPDHHELSTRSQLTVMRG